jgi:hypothetical protein
MDVLNVNYDQDDIHFNKWDAYNFIHQETQSTYKGPGDFESIPPQM